eukprot:1559982-Rhodomonas_salina.1
MASTAHCVLGQYRTSRSEGVAAYARRGTVCTGNVRIVFDFGGYLLPRRFHEDGNDLAPYARSVPDIA